MFPARCDGFGSVNSLLCISSAVTPEAPAFSRYRECSFAEAQDRRRFRRASRSTGREGGSFMLDIRRRGFTMIELLMVLGLIGIVAAIGGPKVAAALQRRTTASAALGQNFFRNSGPVFPRNCNLYIGGAHAAPTSRAMPVIPR